MRTLMRASNGMSNLQGMDRDSAVAAGLQTHSHPVAVPYVKDTDTSHPSSEDLDRVVAEYLIETIDL